MSNRLSNITCWIVTEGIAGTENQCIGVAEALGIKPRIKRIKLREPWKSFSPTLGFERWWTFDPLLFRPWPDLLITSGRKGIAASRYIKKMSDEQTFTVHIQDPRIAPDNFDIVAVPKHDLLRGKNVLVTTATPNRITKHRLTAEKLKFKDLKPGKRPCVAILIGGKSKTHTITQEIAEKIIADLLKLDASLLVTVSRRTPEPIRQLFLEKLKGKHIYIWDGEGDNPYFAFLAYADFILVTNDSASMLSEAATTGKPVYSIPLKGGSEKFSRLYKNLKNAGALRIFEGKLEPWEYSPLNDAEKIAKTVEKALLKRMNG
ncbi:MAG: mitochondrial fission ELM1 family protein [Alphaproteobacteria bacterium]